MSEEELDFSDEAILNRSFPRWKAAGDVCVQVFGPAKTMPGTCEGCVYGGKHKPGCKSGTSEGKRRKRDALEGKRSEESHEAG